MHRLACLEQGLSHSMNEQLIQQLVFMCSQYDALRDLLSRPMFIACQPDPRLVSFQNVEPLHHLAREVWESERIAAGEGLGKFLLSLYLVCAEMDPVVLLSGQLWIFKVSLHPLIDADFVQCRYWRSAHDRTTFRRSRNTVPRHCFGADVG